MIQLTRSPLINDVSPVEVENPEEVQDKIQEITSALAFLMDLVQRGELKVQNRFSIMAATEGYIRDLSKILGYDSDIEKEKVGAACRFEDCQHRDSSS